MAEALPFYRALIDRHHGATLVADVGRGYAQRLANPRYFPPPLNGRVDLVQPNYLITPDKMTNLLTMSGTIAEGEVHLPPPLPPVSFLECGGRVASYF